MKTRSLVGLAALAPFLGASPALYLGRAVDASHKPAVYATKSSEGINVIRMPSKMAIEDLSDKKLLEIIRGYDQKGSQEKSLDALRGWQEPGAQVAYTIEMRAGSGKYTVEKGKGLSYYVRTEYARQNKGNTPSDSRLMIMNAACATDNQIGNANVVHAGQALNLYECVKAPGSITAPSAEPKPRFDSKAFFQGLNPQN